MEKEVKIAGRVAMVPKEYYIHGREYKRLDTVRYQGGVYVAKKDNVNQDPTVDGDNEFWMFMVGTASVDLATNEKPGISKPDGETINIDEEGTLTVPLPIPDGETIKSDDGIWRAVIPDPPEVPGADGETIVYNEEGELSAVVATKDKPGIVKPDGKTITIDDDGTIVGASSGFVGSTEAAKAAMEAGEFTDGQLVFIDDDFIPGGGGGGGTDSPEVYVGDEEPTNGELLWVDTSEEEEDDFITKLVMERVLVEWSSSESMFVGKISREPVDRMYVVTFTSGNQQAVRYVINDHETIKIAVDNKPTTEAYMYATIIYIPKN